MFFWHHGYRRSCHEIHHGRRIVADIEIMFLLFGRDFIRHFVRAAWPSGHPDDKHFLSVDIFNGGTRVIDRPYKVIESDHLPFNGFYLLQT